MGIKDLFKVKGVAGETFKDHSLIKGVIGVDAFVTLRQSLTSGPPLKDSKGRLTLHINTLANKFMNLTNKQIWVFDNIDKREDKEEELAKRSQRSHEIFEHITYTQAIKDLKKMLDLLGIVHITTPPKVEGETYLVEMKRMGIIDYILSTDTDILAYGEDLLYYKKGEYTHYKIRTILSNLGINLNNFRIMCCMMGTDFSPKIRGITPNNVLTNIDMGMLKRIQRGQWAIFSLRCSLVYEDNNEKFKNITSPVFSKEFISFLNSYECKRAKDRATKLVNANIKA